MASDPTDATVRLSDLRRAKAADVSLENLLTAVTGKLQTCARLAVFEYEAGSEGHAELALAFHNLAVQKQEDYGVLKQFSAAHLVRIYADPGSTVQVSAGRVPANSIANGTVTLSGHFENVP